MSPCGTSDRAAAPIVWSRLTNFERLGLVQHCRWFSSILPSSRNRAPNEYSDQTFAWALEYRSSDVRLAALGSPDYDRRGRLAQENLLA